MPATFTIPSAFTAIDKFSGPISRMGNAVNSFAFKSEAALSRVDRAFRTLMTPMTAFRQMLNSIGLYVGIYVFIRAIRGALDVMMDFEQAQINISAVTGKSISQNQELADQARELAVRYGEAATKVSELQYELIKMGFANKGIKPVLEMTPSIVIGARALGADPSELAKMLGADLTAFNIPTSQANNVIDMYAKIADLSALDFSSIQTMLANSRAAWAQTGRPLEELLVLMAVLRNAQLHVATSGTGIKNMTIDNAVANKDLNEQLMKVISSENKIQKAYKMYGRRTFQSVLPLAEALESGNIKGLQDQLAAGSAGYAQRLAETKLQSTKGHLSLLKAAYEELILTIDDGNGGPLSTAIKRYSQIISAMLLLTSGSDAANGKLKTMDSSIVEIAKSALTWLKVIGNLIKLLIAFRLLLIASRIALFLYNVQLGISTAFLIGNVMALRGNVVALAAYRIAAMAATAQQWIFNAAMAANPIGLIIIGIAAMVGLVYTLAKHWESWGAAVSLAFGPLGLLLNHVMSFFNKWEGIKKSFKDGSFLEGIKSIGLALYDAILYPMMQLLEIIGRVTGFDWATNAAARLQAHRENMGIEKLDMAGERSVSEKNTTTKNNVRVDINAPLGYNVFGSDPNVNIKPVLSSTHGWHAPMQ